MRTHVTLTPPGRRTRFELRGESYCLTFWDKKRGRKRVTLNWRRYELAREEAWMLYERWVRGEYDPWSESSTTPSGARLTNLAAAYVDHQSKDTWSPASARNKTLTLRKMIEVVGDRKVGALTTEDFMDFINGPDLQPSTRAGYYQVVHAFLNWCVKEGALRANPLADTPKPQVKRTLPKALRDDERSRLLDAIPDTDWMYGFVVFALETGMRLSEIIHQRWADIDDGLIYVRNHEGFRTKSGHERAVPMTPMVKRVIEGLPKEGTYVFSGPDGKRRSVSWIRKRIKHYARPLGLGWVSPHTFRHTYASVLAKRGVPIGVIQTLMGHADLRMTERYSHFYSEDLREWVGRAFE